MKNSFLKLAFSLAAVSSLAFAEGAFVGVEGSHSFSSKLNRIDVKDGQSGLGAKVGYDFGLFRAY